MSGSFSEQNYENSVIELFENLGYKHVYGPNINRNFKNPLYDDELAFYDALTKPRAIKDFYENDELIAITKELTESLRKNRTVDWQKKESSRAKMRMMIKILLKKHKYPPEGMEDAVQTVMIQCELWTDNNDMNNESNNNYNTYRFMSEEVTLMAAEDKQLYKL